MNGRGRKTSAKALKEGWRSLFSRDQGASGVGTGGWVDGGSAGEWRWSVGQGC